MNALNQLHSAAALASLSLDQLAIDVAQANRNAINLGLPVFVADIVNEVQAGARAKIDVDEAMLIMTDGNRVHHLEPLPDFLLAMIHDGGLVPHLEKRFKGKRAGPGDRP